MEKKNTDLESVERIPKYKESHLFLILLTKSILVGVNLFSDICI